MSMLNAIKKRCRDCQPERMERNKEIFKDCQLKNPTLTNLKKIKAYCLWCMNSDRFEVKFCTSPECSLFQYRLGKNPARAGIGNKQANVQLNIQSSIMPKKCP